MNYSHNQQAYISINTFYHLTSSYTHQGGRTCSIWGIEKTEIGVGAAVGEVGMMVVGGEGVVSITKLNTKIKLQASCYKSPRTGKNKLMKFVSETKT